MVAGLMPINAHYPLWPDDPEYSQGVWDAKRMGKVVRSGPMLLSASFTRAAAVLMMRQICLLAVVAAMGLATSTSIDGAALAEEIKLEEVEKTISKKVEKFLKGPDWKRRVYCRRLKTALETAKVGVMLSAGEGEYLAGKPERFQLEAKIRKARSLMEQAADPTEFEKHLSTLIETESELSEFKERVEYLKKRETRARKAYWIVRNNYEKLCGADIDPVKSTESILGGIIELSEPSPSGGGATAGHTPPSKSESGGLFTAPSKSKSGGFESTWEAWVIKTAKEAAGVSKKPLTREEVAELAKKIATAGTIKCPEVFNWKFSPGVICKGVGAGTAAGIATTLGGCPHGQHPDPKTGECHSR